MNVWFNDLEHFPTAVFRGLGSRKNIDDHCFQKVVQLFNIIRDYFPIRDSKRLECVKKCFLKEEILPHYQNSRFFRTYASSNKMSGPLHVRINECILY